MKFFLLYVLKVETLKKVSSQLKLKKIDAIDHRGLYLVDDDGIPFVLAPDRKWFYPITRGHEYMCDRKKMLTKI